MCGGGLHVTDDASEQRLQSLIGGRVRKIADEYLAQRVSERTVETETGRGSPCGRRQQRERLARSRRERPRWQVLQTLSDEGSSG